MPLKVVWGEKASLDVLEIQAYISRDSWAAADRMTFSFLCAAEAVADHPLSGRVVPEFGRATLREVIVGSYRLVYRVKRGSVQIVRVSHSARLLRVPGERRRIR